MRLLPDTHILIWAANGGDRGSAKRMAAARPFLSDPDNQVLFSAVSIWEVAIKFSRGQADFRVDPVELRAGLLAVGYRELPVTSDHAVRVATLPPIHRDPFDRLLVAQALEEQVMLLTADSVLASYDDALILRV